MLISCLRKFKISSREVQTINLVLFFHHHQILMNQPQVSALTFKLVNTARIAKIHCNNEVIQSHQRNDANNEIRFEMKMDGLIKSLKQLFEKSPAARYYNVDILKYQLDTASGTQSCPLQVVSHWKCEPQSTCLKIDYKYNPYALSSLEPLRNVAFSVKVDGVQDFQSKPQANWCVFGRLVERALEKFKLKSKIQN